MYSIMSSTNGESFTSFPIWIPFICFSSLLAVSRISLTMLNNSGVLFLIFGGMLSVFNHWKCLLCVCCIWPLFYWGRFPLWPFSEEFLSLMHGKFCWKLFLYLLRLSCDFSLLIYYMAYHTDWFAYIEEFLHPLDKPNLIMVYDPFNVFFFFLILFARTLLRSFATMFISDIGL